MAKHYRDRILALLATHPEGMATLAIIRHFGEEERAITAALARSVEGGVLVRSAAGKITPSTVWRLLAPKQQDDRQPPRRGAAELARANERCAMARAGSGR
jgi:hypothetical protein